MPAILKDIHSNPWRSINHIHRMVEAIEVAVQISGPVWNSQISSMAKGGFQARTS